MSDVSTQRGSAPGSAVTTAPRRLSAGVLLALALAAAGTLTNLPRAFAADAAPSYWLDRPEFRDLVDAITFRHSFDHDSLLPDMAAGDWHFTAMGKPELAPGLYGKALVAGTGALAFRDPANWTLAGRGGLLFWVAAGQWNHVNAGNTNMVLSWGSGFYVERQGPLRKPDGGWTRCEALLAGVQVGVKGSAGAGCADWKPGEWHLVAVNWAWPQIAISVDGRPFGATVLPGKPGGLGGPVVGSHGGEPALLDEFCCFKRPLTDGEIHALYEAMKPVAPAN